MRCLRRGFPRPPPAGCTPRTSRARYLFVNYQENSRSPRALTTATTTTNATNTATSTSKNSHHSFQRWATESVWFPSTVFFLILVNTAIAAAQLEFFFLSWEAKNVVLKTLQQVHSRRC